MSLMQDEYCITGKPADAESEYEPAYRKHAFFKDSINKMGQSFFLCGQGPKPLPSVI